MNGRVWLTNKFLYYLRGLCFMSQENNKNALSDFTKVIELDKTFDKAYIMRGLVYYALENYQKAIEDWKMAQKINKANKKDVSELIEKAIEKMKK